MQVYRVASKPTDIRGSTPLIRTSQVTRMKQIKGTEGEIIKVEEGSPVQPFHAYISLMLAILREPFVSSDAKYLMIQSSYTYLSDMGYTSEEIEKYIKPLQDVDKQNIHINSLMG